MKGGRWVKMPLDRALAWDSLSFYDRAVGCELFRLYQERVVQIGATWQAALVRALGVSGPERSAVYRALDRVVEAGLLLVSDGTIQLLYTDETLAAYRKSLKAQLAVPQTSTQHQPETISVSLAGQLAPVFDSSARDDSNLVSQREERKREERENAADIGTTSRIELDSEHAAPSPNGDSAAALAVAGRKWFAAVMGRDDFDHQGKWRRPYVEIAKKPPEERAAVGATLQGEPWVQQNLSRVTPGHVLDYWPKYRDGQEFVQVSQPEVVSPAVKRLRAELDQVEAEQRELPSANEQTDEQQARAYELSILQGDLLMRVKRAEASS